MDDIKATLIAGLACDLPVHMLVDELEAVESGITTFEDEFMAHIVMPDGKTVASHVRPRIAAAYESGTMQPLLPAPGRPN